MIIILWKNTQNYALNRKNWKINMKIANEWRKHFFCCCSSVAYNICYSYFVSAIETRSWERVRLMNILLCDEFMTFHRFLIPSSFGVSLSNTKTVSGTRLLYRHIIFVNRLTNVVDCVLYGKTTVLNFNFNFRIICCIHCSHNLLVLLLLKFLK